VAGWSRAFNVELSRLIFTRSGTLGDSAHLLISVAGYPKQRDGSQKYHYPADTENDPKQHS